MSELGGIIEGEMDLSDELILISTLDYRAWLTHATAEGKADPGSKSVMDANIREIEAMVSRRSPPAHRRADLLLPPQLRGDKPLPTPRAAPAAAAPTPTPTAATPPAAKVKKGAIPPGRADPALQVHLRKIHKAHESLVKLWEEKSGQAITVWRDIVDPDVRKAKIESGIVGVKPKKNYPEVRSLFIYTTRARY